MNSVYSLIYKGGNIHILYSSVMTKKEIKLSPIKRLKREGKKS